MFARIRYGREADIFQSIDTANLKLTEDDLVLLRGFGRTILSFSASIQAVPDLEAFSNITRNLGFVLNAEADLGVNDQFVGLIPSPIRTVEVVNADEISGSQIYELGQSLVDISLVHTHVNDGVIFYDHTVVPRGEVIAGG